MLNYGQIKIVEKTCFTFSHKTIRNKTQTNYYTEKEYLASIFGKPLEGNLIIFCKKIVTNEYMEFGKNEKKVFIDFYQNVHNTYFVMKKVLSLLC